MINEQISNLAQKRKKNWHVRFHTFQTLEKETAMSTITV